MKKQLIGLGFVLVSACSSFFDSISDKEAFVLADGFLAAAKTQDREAYLKLTYLGMNPEEFNELYANSQNHKVHRVWDAELDAFENSRKTKMLKAFTTILSEAAAARFDWGKAIVENASPKGDDAIVVYKSGNSRLELYFDDCISTIEGPLLFDVPSVLDQNLETSLSLIEAVRVGDTENARRQLEAGANVNKQIESGWAPLHWAARDGNEKLVEMLIANGANLDITLADGWTPLHFAATRGHVEIVKLLINKGANVNVRNSAGWTPLFRSILRNHKECFQLLVSSGSDLNLKANDGLTPLDLAIKNNRLEFASIIRNHHTVSLSEIPIADKGEGVLGQAVTTDLNVSKDISEILKDVDELIQGLDGPHETKDEATKSRIANEAEWAEEVKKRMGENPVEE